MGGAKDKGTGLAVEGGGFAFPEEGHGAANIPPQAASGRNQPLSVCVSPGAAAQNIKIFLRFISSPSRSFEIPAIRGRKLL